MIFPFLLHKKISSVCLVSMASTLNITEILPLLTWCDSDGAPPLLQCRPSCKTHLHLGHLWCSQKALLPHQFCTVRLKKASQTPPPPPTHPPWLCCINFEVCVIHELVRSVCCFIVFEATWDSVNSVEITLYCPLWLKGQHRADLNNLHCGNTTMRLTSLSHSHGNDE